MSPHIYLLITIGVLAGFFARPLNMFVFSKVVSLEKYIQKKSILLLLVIASMVTTLAVTFSAVYYSLKFAGFIPLDAHATAFIISFFIGGALWVVYARLFNRSCRIG